MDWYCTFTPLKIRVNQDLNFKGYYDFLEDPFCEKCSSPGVKTEECILRDLVYGFNRVYAIGKYTRAHARPYPLLSSHIRLLKDFKRTDLAIPLGYALNILIQQKYQTLSTADYVVPVPAHSNKVSKRGFNQVELIMNNLCAKSPLKPLLCLEQVKNYEMRNFTLDERYDIVKNAFKFNTKYRDEIADRYIVLIDDVVTSCATVSECSRILLDNGARKVDVLTCGRNVLDDSV